MWFKNELICKGKHGGREDKVRRCTARSLGGSKREVGCMLGGQAREGVEVFREPQRLEEKLREQL